MALCSCLGVQWYHPAMHFRSPRSLRLLPLFIICILFYVVSYVWFWRPEGEEVFIPREVQMKKERKNLVYIKMIKCASETLDAMFHRFSLVRDLSCVLPVGNKLYLGWPYMMEESFYRPSLAVDGQFNVLSDHAVYSQAIRNIMPEDTVYITSLRDPFNQFKSMFNYYNLKTMMDIQSADPLEEYFAHQEKYEALYKKPNPKKYCIPDGFSMTRNLMSFNLGFPFGFPPGTPDHSTNATAIDDWLQKVTQTFKFVIIVEHFDESLVILKHLMNWGVKDILYLVRNEGNYQYKTNQRQELIDKFKKWSVVDYTLYEKYLAILRQRLKEGGEDLLKEISNFKQVRQRLQTLCANGTEIIEFEQSQWNEPFQVTKPFCDMLNQNLLETLKAIYDQRNYLGKIRMPSENYC